MSIHIKQDIDQSVFDCYNGLLFSKDKDVLYKMLTRVDFFQSIKDLNGDIVECGVFKGAGLMLWLRLLDLHSPHDSRKVIGFDFFCRDFMKELDSETDRNAMAQVFSRCDTLLDVDISVEGLSSKFSKAAIESHRYELVKGDVSQTSRLYLEGKPGFRISLLYLDMDLEKPTADALEHFWPRVVKGGIVVFDEYAYHVWSESNAVDDFIAKNGLKLRKTGVKSPTAYVIKE